VGHGRGQSMPAETGRGKRPGDYNENSNENRVTVIHFVPSMLTLFLEHLRQTGERKGLKCFKTGYYQWRGLNRVHREKLFKEILDNELGTKLSNLYGPTEATIDVSYFDCFQPGYETPGVIPIGKPIANIQLYVMSRQLYWQP